MSALPFVGISTMCI